MALFYLSVHVIYFAFCGSQKKSKQIDFFNCFFNKNKGDSTTRNHIQSLYLQLKYHYYRQFEHPNVIIKEQNGHFWQFTYNESRYHNDVFWAPNQRILLLLSFIFFFCLIFCFLFFVFIFVLLLCWLCDVLVGRC